MPGPIGIHAVRGTKKYPYNTEASDTRLKEIAVAIGAPRKDNPNGYTSHKKNPTSDGNIFGSRTDDVPNSQLRKALKGAMNIMILAGTAKSPWDWKYRLIKDAHVGGQC